MENYFKTLVEKLPGGVAVIHIHHDGSTELEFVSAGFTSMTGLSQEEMVDLYKVNLLAGVHPDDRKAVGEKLQYCLDRDAEQGELVGRMLKKDGGYVWVKDNISIKRLPDGTQRLYCIYTDITKDMEEKEQLRRQYEDLILQHYRAPGPDTLVAGHCNVTKDRILGIRDYTDSNLLNVLGTEREGFFMGISDMITDQAEREQFREKFLNRATLEAFQSNKTDLMMECFIRLPNGKKGCYVRFKVDLVEVPDTGDITGILTVTDITRQIISERILNQLSITSHDFILDVDLAEDHYKFVTHSEDTCYVHAEQGKFSDRVAMMADTAVIARDRVFYLESLDKENIRKRLESKGFYTFSYSEMDEAGEVRTKTMTVASIDVRLERVCIACTDITESVHQQQGLLNMIAYTFDQAGLIHVGSGHFTIYTRQTVQENLPPYTAEKYDDVVDEFLEFYDVPEEAKARFQISAMLAELEKRPQGYHFVLPYVSEEGPGYKRINVLWGDQNHEIICIVRADVTEMLAAEHQAKEKLEAALGEAKRANLAKSEFLSSMSHDSQCICGGCSGITQCRNECTYSKTCRFCRILPGIGKSRGHQKEGRGKRGGGTLCWNIQNNIVVSTRC